jgi:cytochrome c556
VVGGGTPVRMKRLHGPQKWTFIALGTMALGAGSFVVAQEHAEQIIQDRVANFREIGAAYKHIGDEVQSSSPDMRKIKDSAQLIKNRGADIVHWFPPGSEPLAEPPENWLDRFIGWFSSDGSMLPSEIKSHAKRAVWTERAQFEQAHGKFMTEANRMWQIVNDGQPTEIHTQFKRLGQACKGCHDVYREKLD